jgi:hypothetical protein
LPSAHAQIQLGANIRIVLECGRSPGEAAGKSFTGANGEVGGAVGAGVGAGVDIGAVAGAVAEAGAGADATGTDG